MSPMQTCSHGRPHIPEAFPKLRTMEDLFPLGAMPAVCISLPEPELVPETEARYLPVDGVVDSDFARGYPSRALEKFGTIIEEAPEPPGLEVENRLLRQENAKITAAHEELRKTVSLLLQEKEELLSKASESMQEAARLRAHVDVGEAKTRQLEVQVEASCEHLVALQEAHAMQLMRADSFNTSQPQRVTGLSPPATTGLSSIVGSTSRFPKHGGASSASLDSDITDPPSLSKTVTLESNVTIRTAEAMSSGSLLRESGFSNVSSSDTPPAGKFPVSRGRSIGSSQPAEQASARGGSRSLLVPMIAVPSQAHTTNSRGSNRAGSNRSGQPSSSPGADERNRLEALGRGPPHGVYRMASAGDSRSTKNVRGAFAPWHPSGQLASSPRVLESAQVRRNSQAESSKAIGAQRMTRAGSLQISAKGQHSGYPAPPRSARVDRSGSPHTGATPNPKALPRPQSRGPTSTGTPNKQAPSVSITPRPAHMQLPKNHLMSTPTSSGAFPMTPEPSRPSNISLTGGTVAAGLSTPASTNSLTLGATRVSPVILNHSIASTAPVKRSKSDGIVLR